MIFIFSLSFSIFLTFLWKYLNRFKVFKYSQYHPFTKRYLKSKSCCFLRYQVQASFPWSLNSFLSLLSSQMLASLPQNLAAGNSAHFQLTVSIGHESGHSLSGLSASRSQSSGWPRIYRFKSGRTDFPSSLRGCWSIQFLTGYQTKDLSSLLPVSQKFLSSPGYICLSHSAAVHQSMKEENRADLLATGKSQYFLTQSQKSQP